jgi:hypothetical protein
MAPTFTDVGVDGDVVPSFDLGQGLGHQLCPGAVVGVHAAEATYPAPHPFGALDHRHRQAQVGEGQGGPQSGDAGTDDQHPRDGLHLEVLQGFTEARVGDPGPHQLDGLAGGPFRVVGVCPGALLTQVDLGVHVGVEPRPLGYAPERQLVEGRGTGGHHHAVELQ